MGLDAFELRPVSCAALLLGGIAVFVAGLVVSADVVRFADLQSFFSHFHLSITIN